MKLFKIEVSSDGSIVVIGRLWNSIINNDITEYRGSTDWWIVKLNSLGQKLWYRTLGGSGMENTFISIRLTNDNGYIIGGGSDSGDGDLTGLGLGGNFGYWVVKLNNSGGIVWQWADNKGGNLYDIRQTKDGGYIICGTGDDGNPATTGSALFVKLNSAGTVVWKKNYGGTSSSEPYNIQETSDGQFLAIASTQSKELPGFHYHSYAPDVWIIKIDYYGNKVWEKCYGGTGEDWLRTGYSTTTNLLTHNVNSSNYQNEFIDKSGNIFFSVSTNSLDGDVKGLHKTSNDIWFVRLSQSLLTSSLTVASPSPKLFNENFSHSVYPNPFSQRATLAFTSGETAATRIEIFNAHGILLKNINAGMTRKGESYRYELNLIDLPAGKYTYKLINGINTGTGKLIKTN